MNTKYVITLSTLALFSFAITSAADYAMRNQKMRARREAIEKRDMQEAMPAAPMAKRRRVQPVKPDARKRAIAGKTQAAAAQARKAKMRMRKPAEHMKEMEARTPQSVVTPVALTYNGGEKGKTSNTTKSEIDDLQNQINEDMNLLARRRADAEHANNKVDQKAAKELYEANDALYEQIKEKTKLLEEKLRSGYLPDSE